jgi:RHS repeat-associated protein
MTTTADVHVRLPRELSSSAVFRTTYTYNHAGWVTGASDETRAHRADDETLPNVFRYEYDERANQTRWRSEHASQDDRGRDVRWVHWPNGLVKRRTAIKTLDRAGTPDDTTSTRSYEYLYNANRSLVRVIDCDAKRDGVQDDPQSPLTCSATQPSARQTLYVRDLAERETRIDEQWTDGRDVRLDYDTGNTGWLTQRRTDGTLSGNDYIGAQAKSTTFERDSLGRELTMTVDPSSGANRVSQSRWYDSGALRERTKPNGTVDRWSLNALGQRTLHERDADGSENDESQSYTYDINGNRKRDERGDHAFNARNQLVSWTRPASRGRADRRGWRTEYTLDGSGAQTLREEYDDQTLKTRTELTLDGDRLETATVQDYTQAVALTSTQTYSYDDAGNVQRIRTTVTAADGSPVESAPAPSTALEPAECQQEDVGTPSTRTTRYCYDEFNRQVFATGSGIDPVYLVYDGLDRRDRKLAKDRTSGAELRTHDYSYIGSTELLSSETVTTPGVTTADEHSSYDYDSQGARQGQDKDGGYRAYAIDANGSTLGLEAANGAIADGDRYDYDPYGELDRAPSGPDSDDLDTGLSQAARDNPFRFGSAYYDSGVKTYDMHARHYRPELGRFLSRDTYASAAGEHALQADPLTQNRYAFAGGNPVDNIEWDGHGPCGNRLCPLSADDGRNADARRNLSSRRATAGAELDDRIPGRERTYRQQRTALRAQNDRVRVIDATAIEGRERADGLRRMRENPTLTTVGIQQLSAAGRELLKSDNAVGIDDTYDAISKYIGAAGDTLAATMRLTDYFSGPLPGGAATSIKFSGPTTGFIADLLQGKSVKQAVARTVVGTSTSLTLGGQATRCPRLRHPYAVGTCFVVVGAGAVGFGQWTQDKAEGFIGQ